MLSVEAHGLDDVQRTLDALQADMPAMVERVVGRAIDVVIAEARPRIPRKTGRAAKSLQPKVKGSVGQILAGGRTVPYYRWLEYGCRHRQAVTKGRYVYPAAQRKREEVQGLMLRELDGIDW